MEEKLNDGGPFFSFRKFIIAVNLKAFLHLFRSETREGSIQICEEFRNRYIRNLLRVRRWARRIRKLVCTIRSYCVRAPHLFHHPFRCASRANVSCDDQTIPIKVSTAWEPILGCRGKEIWMLIVKCCIVFARFGIGHPACDPSLF